MDTYRILRNPQAFISKKRPGDKYPKYFVCTDITLSSEALARDNIYLKEGSG
jgi:hypothetical protein